MKKELFYPSRSELLNYVIHIRQKRVDEYLIINKLLVKYPFIKSEIEKEYFTLKQYATSDINIKEINLMVNKKKSIEFYNQKLDLKYSDEFKYIINIIKNIINN